MKAILKFILPRLKERSTYLGIVGLLAAVGVAVDPTYVDLALTVGAAVAGILGVIWPDKPAA